MRALPLAAAVPRARLVDRTSTAMLHLAGLALFTGAVVMFMGIITAESLYPAAYSTSANEISDLGGTRPPEGLVYQPVATIFNTTMLLSGILVALAAVAIGGSVRRWWVTAPIAVLGLAIIAVALFPGPTGTPHAVSAMVAFISGGIAAVTSASVARPPFRYVIRALGTVNLVLLASYFVQGDASPLWILGVGGAERWVAYPILLYLMGFGGYLAGLAATDGGAQAGSGTSSPIVASAVAIDAIRASGAAAGR